jgi:hypothetical protein
MMVAGGHRAAGAHGDEGGGRVPSLQFVQGGGHQPSAGAAHRVAERDGAAVDIDPVRIGPVHALPGQHHRRERLVDLEQVNIADRHAAAVEHPFGGRDRPVQVVVRLGPEEALGDDPGARRDAQRLRPAGLQQQHRGRAVGDLRGRARGMQPVRQHRPQPGQRFHAGLAQALVAVHGAGLAGGLVAGVGDRRLDRHDLPVKPAFRPGALGGLLGAQAERVDAGPGQPAPLGDPLGGDVLVRQVDVPGRRAGRPGVRADVGP